MLIVPSIDSDNARPHGVKGTPSLSDDENRKLGVGGYCAGVGGQDVLRQAGHVGGHDDQVGLFSLAAAIGFWSRSTAGSWLGYAAVWMPSLCFVDCAAPNATSFSANSSGVCATTGAVGRLILSSEPVEESSTEARFRGLLKAILPHRTIRIQLT